MRSDHLLQLNPYKTIRCLSGLVADQEIEKIQKAIDDNVRQLIRLGESHLRFASAATGQNSWRQRVSRGYYSCYCTSRAIRLAIEGTYSQDPGDHKLVGKLPDGFPQRDIWSNFLTTYRADRNLADYDHTVNESALEHTSQRYVEEARKFVKEVKAYLRKEGHLK